MVGRAMSFLKNFYEYFRFYINLKPFLETIISKEAAKEAIKQRLVNREENFLRLIKKGIFLNKKSPYLKIFKLIQISYDDIERMINKNGLSETLNILREDGIYLTVEEFKGKKTVVRRNAEFRFKEQDFDNPLLSAYYNIETGGTRSSGTRTLLDLEYISAKAVYYPLVFDIYNLKDCKIGLWAPTPPLGAGILPLLHFAKTGKIVSKWFSPIKPDIERAMSLKFMIGAAKNINIDLPYPEYTNIQDVEKVVNWIIDVKAKYGNVLFLSLVSQAVRICEFARINSLDISGVKFWIFGEPITEARYNVIKSSGCEVIPLYSFIELGSIGFGCNKRSSPEEIHFFQDSMALIQHNKFIPSLGENVGSFLFSSILPSSPKILLNVENGDYGIIDKRPCDCILGELGLETHIKNIHSFEKLNAEGMTFFAFDAMNILEEILPNKFGGTLLDYQLSEEVENTKARLNLVISPDLGIIDEDKIKSVLLDELKRRSKHGKQMVEVLKQAGTLCIKREYPAATRAGKICPLAIKKYK